MKKNKLFALFASAAVLTSLVSAGTALAAGPDRGPGAGWQGRPGMMSGRGPGAFGVVGLVSAINGNIISVDSKIGMGPRGWATSTPRGNNAPQNQNTATTTYSVDATNATIYKDNATSTIAGIALGDFVAVQGTTTGTTVTASIIRDGVPGKDGRMMGRPSNTFGNMMGGNPTPGAQGFFQRLGGFFHRMFSFL